MRRIRTSIIAFAAIALGSSAALADRPLSRTTDEPRRPKRAATMEIGSMEVANIPPQISKMIRRPDPATGAVECRTFHNRRTNQAVSIPYRSTEEWSRSSNEPTRPYQVNVTMNCYCNQLMNMGQVNNAVADVLGNDPIRDATPKFPLPGYDPPYQADPATILHVCQAMGCGAPDFVRTREFDDPSDDALLQWNGSDWVKVPADWVNLKLENRGPTLRCTNP